ncbi:hypothetical protein HPB52_010390 [Rhipicephalus sanguineus]|uniref:Uncharacterized protein n=1 Tax=Rhipicephalus sanguineus TaxID=34632 RepID=A0A9D4QEF8_RHISA|nr:hypothetical protein HPB52_010390 [Rhipicephalus sanguineus]
MDYRTRNRPFSYLRPQLQMPSPLLERALFPNSSRSAETDGTQPEDSEQGQEQEEDTAEEQPDAVPVVEGGRRAAVITGPSSSTAASRNPALNAAQARNKDKRQPASLRCPAANRGSAKVAKRGAAAANGRYGVNRAPLANSAAVSRNAGARGAPTEAADPGTPVAATSARERPGWRATPKGGAPKSGRSMDDPTARQLSHSTDQEYDCWPPSTDYSSMFMTTVESVGPFATAGDALDDGEMLYQENYLEDNAAASCELPPPTGSRMYLPIPRIAKEFYVKHLGTQCAVILVVSLLIASFMAIMVPELFSKRGSGGFGAPVVTGRRHPPVASERNAKIGDEQVREPAVSDLLTSRTAPKATKKPVFTLVDYEDTRAPGEEVTYAFECDTDACRWQSRLVDEKLNASVDPCVDIYGYVCSAAWDLNGDLPYRAAGRAFLINEVTRYLQEHMHTMPAVAATGVDHIEQSFLDRSSLVLNVCLNNKAPKDLTQWDGIRALLRETGLEEWPYSDTPPAQPQQPFRLDRVLKLIDRQLAIFPIVFISLRKSVETSAYVLHLDAPRDFLFVHYEIQKHSESLPYREILRQILTLWKTLTHSNDLAEEIERFEAQLLEASHPFNKAAWKTDVTYAANKFPRMPKFRVDSYLSYLRPEEEGDVVVLNPVYASKLYSILRVTSPRTILNFLGFRVVAVVAPLLPQESIPQDILRMGYPSFQHSLNPRTQSCFHLVERVFPHGVRWILRDILARTTDLDRQWAATIKSMVSSLAHTFRAGTTWMQSVEIDDVIKRLKSLQVGYLAGQEREEEVEHYYASVKATDASLDNPVSYYGELLSKSLRKYWRSSADGANYDARFSERLIDLDVAWTRSPESALRLYLTSSTVAAASLVTRSNYPSTLFSLLAADVTRALFLASLDNPQWSSWTRDRFQSLQYCLLNRYKHGVRAANASAANVRDFLADIFADNAVLKPLITAFKRFSHGAVFVPGRRSAGLTVNRLFFINYAAAFCVPKVEEEQVRKRLRYRLGLPARTRVNLALQDLKDFRDAFKCPRQLGASRCPVWNVDSRDGLSDNDVD